MSQTVFKYVDIKLHINAPYFGETLWSTRQGEAVP